MPDRPTIRISRIEDLLAVVPYLLGFQPSHSLVLLAVTANTIPLVARMDLPDADKPSAGVRAAASAAVSTLTTFSNVRAVLIGYGPAGPVRAAVDAVRDALRGTGVPILRMLRVADSRLWDLTDETSPTTGVPLVPDATAAAAAAVYAGLVALPSRDAVADTLAPLTGPARAAMLAATTDACADVLTQLEAARATVAPPEDPDAVWRTAAGQNIQATARATLVEVQAAYQARRPVDDRLAATATVLLAIPSLREFAIGHTSGVAWQVDMWTDLVRRAEPPFTAEPAVMLALCALQAGNGVLANLAIDRALDADPDDWLTRLLAAAIAAGALDPHTTTALLQPYRDARAATGVAPQPGTAPGGEGPKEQR